MGEKASKVAILDEISINDRDNELLRLIDKDNSDSFRVYFINLFSLLHKIVL